MKILDVVKKAAILILGVSIIFIAAKSAYWIHKRFEENRILREVIDRLSADSRIAEVLVTGSRFNEENGKIETTIKFLEYDAKGKPLTPKYFTFQGNIVQFQTLVIRFQDKFVKAGDKLRGKSAYLFLRAFVLDPEKAQIFDLTEANEVPEGYKVSEAPSEFEKKLWADFWKYALDPSAREHVGIKNAQIEAPGMMFLPGTIYTIKIEHNGGIRIDTQPIPEILRGEMTKSTV